MEIVQADPLSYIVMQKSFRLKIFTIYYTKVIFVIWHITHSCICCKIINSNNKAIKDHMIKRRGQQQWLWKLYSCYNYIIIKASHRNGYMLLVIVWQVGLALHVITSFSASPLELSLTVPLQSRMQPTPARCLLWL
jgi:hypothetical protein